jgi:hypothetical protein
VARIAGVNHLQAVRAFEKVDFKSFGKASTL